MRTLARAAEAARERVGKPSGPAKELTWVKAVVVALAITAVLIVTLGAIPSIFTYWWAGKNQEILDLVNNGLKKVTGRTLIKDVYMSVRIRDMVSMGYQTTVFAAFIVGAYIWGERRRRRLGQRGGDDVKGYLPGK
ncbi:MAG: hypothetical protein ACRDJ4_03515 [Actinomycetota bacterium]